MPKEKGMRIHPVIKCPWTFNNFSLLKPVTENDYEVDWKGTHGIGDYMLALNTCHNLSVLIQRRIKLRIHYPHGPDYYFSYEDPETIIERGSYIHQLYWRKHDVAVEHVYNSNDERIYIEMQQVLKSASDNHMRTGPDREKRANPLYGLNNWVFDPKYFVPSIRDKVVIWRPKFNFTDPPNWKKVLSDDEWDMVIKKLKGRGWKIVELDYRVPIREAVYHISTCRWVLCYDGMWHHISKLFGKPTVVLGRNPICRIGNQQAVWCKGWGLGGWQQWGGAELKHIIEHPYLGMRLLDEAANLYMEKARSVYNEYRSSSY